MHGKGIMKYADGSIYEGDWVNDVMHGEGIFIYDDGSKYEGEFQNGT